MGIGTEEVMSTKCAAEIRVIDPLQELSSNDLKLQLVLSTYVPYTRLRTFVLHKHTFCTLHAQACLRTFLLHYSTDPEQRTSESLAAPKRCFFEGSLSSF